MKFFKYSVSLILFLSFISAMGFGAVVKYYYDGGNKYQFLQKTVMLISAVPVNVAKMIRYRTLNPDRPNKLDKHSDKNRFERFITKKRSALLVLPRYEFNLKTGVVDIIDLKNFEIIHTYKHNSEEMNNKVTNIQEFPRIKIDDAPIRFEYRHPLILNDGSLISDSDYSVAFKIDFCSNLQWVNQEEMFHHSKMLDHEGKIWIGGILNPYPDYTKKYFNLNDDSIIKLNSNGEILYNKSVIELLLDNQIYKIDSFNPQNTDPIHLNDIEPALNDTLYWKKGDVFLSLRNLSTIIHYRPSTNLVINHINGPFTQQHDVDIISNKEISIFNNNNSFSDNKYSEILIYNFETKTFKKLFNDQLQKENFKTITQGLSHIFEDGSLMVEEQNHGRIILFNNKGEKEWEFVNKDENGNIGFISWSRVIEDEIFIEKFKSMVINKKCIN